MRKTIALFGIALALLLTALMIGLRTVQAPPVPTPVVEQPVLVVEQPVVHTPGQAALSIGDTVHLDGSLSNAFLRVGETGQVQLLMDLVAKEGGVMQRSKMAGPIVV